MAQPTHKASAGRLRLAIRHFLIFIINHLKRLAAPDVALRVGFGACPAVAKAMAGSLRFC